MEEVIDKRNRIEDVLDLQLGTVLTDSIGHFWVYVGKQRTTTGFNHFFVREGDPTFNYNCSFYDTLVKKFPMAKKQR